MDLCPDDRLDALEARLRSENLALNKAIASLETRLDEAQKLLGLGLSRNDPDTLTKRVAALEEIREISRDCRS